MESYYADQVARASHPIGTLIRAEYQGRWKREMSCTLFLPIMVRIRPTSQGCTVFELMQTSIGLRFGRKFGEMTSAVVWSSRD